MKMQSCTKGGYHALYTSVILLLLLLLLLLFVACTRRMEITEVADQNVTLKQQRRSGQQKAIRLQGSHFMHDVTTLLDVLDYTHIRTIRHNYF